MATGARGGSIETFVKAVLNRQGRAGLPIRDIVIIEWLERVAGREGGGGGGFRLLDKTTRTAIVSARAARFEVAGRGLVVEEPLRLPIGFPLVLVGRRELHGLVAAATRGVLRGWLRDAVGGDGWVLRLLGMALAALAGGKEAVNEVGETHGGGRECERSCGETEKGNGGEGRGVWGGW